jgi:hypothetical protein
MRRFSCFLAGELGSWTAAGATEAGMGAGLATPDFVTSAIFFSAGFDIFFIGLAFLFLSLGFIGFLTPIHLPSVWRAVRALSSGADAIFRGP